MAGSARRPFSTGHTRHFRQNHRTLAIEVLELRTFLNGSQVILGPPTEIYDQPYVDIELRNGAQGLGPYGSDDLGDSYNHVLLDSGANSITLVSDAAAELIANGLQ